MSYDNPEIQEYQWAEDTTFGGTTVTHNIIGPKGKVGYVRDLAVEVTTSLVGTTTVPELLVGISSGDSTFGRYRLGTTASAGYNVGVHRASTEPITGNPPRTLGDFSGHVVLDGGPLTSAGIAGGSYGTVIPAGRIPAGPLMVTGWSSQTATTGRYFVTGLTPAPGGLSTGQKVLVQGVGGATATANGVLTVAAIDTTNYAYIDLSSFTPSGTYTSGGIIMPQICITCKAGSGSQAGGGIVRVRVQWVGINLP